MDVTTQQLRGFVRVAELGSFTRAATESHITQPALSRQVRELESRLGVSLLQRTSRRVELTKAGSVFLETARTMLDALEHGARQARRTHAHGGRSMTVGFLIGAAMELTPLVLGEFRRRFPDVVLEMHADIDDASAGLSRGTADVALLRLPVSTPGIKSAILYVEPRTIAVPADHWLAGRTEVTFADVADLPLIGTTIPDPAVADFWALNDCRDASSPPANIVFEMPEDLLAMLEHVASGTACMVSDATESRLLGHPLVSHVPIVDVPGSPVAVAWREDNETELVKAFVDTAVSIRDRESSLIEAVVSVAPPTE